MKIPHRMMYPDTLKQQKGEFHIPGRNGICKIIKSPCKCSIQSDPYPLALGSQYGAYSPENAGTK